MQPLPTSSQRAIVLRGISLDGRPDWIFAPMGWNADEIERRFAFSGSPRSGRRLALILPSQLKQLVGQYGEQPVADLPARFMLGALMQREMLAVEILIARADGSGGLGHAAVP